MHVDLDNPYSARRFRDREDEDTAFSPHKLSESLGVLTPSGPHNG